MGHTSNLTSLGVTYEIVSNIPKVRSDNFIVWFKKSLAHVNFNRLILTIICYILQPLKNINAVVIIHCCSNQSTLGFTSIPNF